MHWVEHGGVLVPRRIGGHAALDFCNTWAGWHDPGSPRSEWLRDYSALVAWAGYAELLADGDEAALLRRTGQQAEAVLSDARRLRTAVHTAVLDPTDDRALAVVSGFVRRAAAHLRIRSGADPAWDVAPTRRVELPLHRVAWAAGDLLTSGRLGAVGECPGHECGWLFLNPTGRRRWCSMSSCGNRAKVAAHARRRG